METTQEQTFPSNYTEEVKALLYDDYENIPIKISNHPDFPEVERYIIVTNVNVGFKNNKRIQLDYEVLHIKDGKSFNHVIQQYNPPIVATNYELMIPRNLDGSYIMEYEDQLVQDTDPVTGALLYDPITREPKMVIKPVLKRVPKYSAMMPMFSAPISDTSIVLAFVYENDEDKWFDKKKETNNLF